MKLLVIGSQGFIGSHCYNYFVSKKYEVYHCDIVDKKDDENYFKVDQFIPNYEDVFKSIAFDFCINCSGAASVPNSITNPEHDYRLNVSNVFYQLEAIRKYNSACKYINLSSAAVYGNPEYLPIDEAHPLNPISPYGYHKKMAEDICASFEHCFGIKTVSLRVFSCYGEGLKKQLFWDLHLKAQNNTNVDLYGTGDESRDFIYVADLVVAIECVVNSDNWQHKVLNVSSGIESYIKNVVDDFYQLYPNKTISVNFLNKGRPGDPSNWVANIDRVKRIGFRSKTSMKAGLTNYIAWLKEIQ